MVTEEDLCWGELESWNQPSASLEQPRSTHVLQGEAEHSQAAKLQQGHCLLSGATGHCTVHDKQSSRENTSVGSGKRGQCGSIYRCE